MRLRLKLLCLSGALFACGGGGSDHPDGGSNPDGGTIPSRYLTSTLDATKAGDERQAISVAVGPNDRLGVAYFAHVKEGGIDYYDINYVEWANGVASTPETIRRVRRIAGLSLAFAPSGQPAVGYLGGNDAVQTFWFQSDAAVAYRQPNGTWQEQVAVTTSGEGGAATGLALNDNGFLVGIWPALAFDGTKAWLAYRDCHNGQAPIGDWAASDLEMVSGGPASWQHEMAVRGSDASSERLGYGGHIQMTLVGGQPALITDSIFGSADGYGKDLYFAKRAANGTWTAPKKILQTANNQLGGSLAYDANFGFGVAVLDREGDKLSFVSSTNGGTTWSFPDDVFQEGTGGWYPTLAIDPVNHDPTVAYYICARAAGKNEGQCVDSEDELRIATRIQGVWSNETVTTEGGSHLKLAFLSTGKRVLVYRSTADSSLKLAVEK